MKSKLPHIGTTIFSKMSQLAIQHQAINLAQGFPDFETDQELKKLIGLHSHNNHNQYAGMLGVEKLRQNIARKIENAHQIEVNSETEITLTAGATQAIFTVIATLISPGDEVIIIEPAYDSYQPSVEIFGGIVIPIQTHFPDYEINWDELEAKITDKTRLIIINNPNNPSTKILKPTDIDALAKIVQDKEIYILSDDVYENIVFDDLAFSPLYKHPTLKEKTFCVASFGKLFHITGWKVGYCFASEKLTREFRKVHQFNVFSVNTPAQMAIADFMDNEEHYLGLCSFFQAKRDYFLDALQTSKFNFTRCESTYFATANYEAYSDENAMDFAQNLTVNHKVASIPVSAFYHDELDEKTIRFCFAKKQETLDKAIENLLKL